MNRTTSHTADLARGAGRANQTNSLGCRSGDGCADERRRMVNRMSVVCALVGLTALGGVPARAVPMPAGMQADTNGDGLNETVVLDSSTPACDAAYVALTSTGGPLALVIGTGGGPGEAARRRGYGEDDVFVRAPVTVDHDLDHDGDMDVYCSPSVDTGPAGRACAFNSTTDLTREPGWQTGQISAGPLATLAGGTLYCKIVVNGWSHSSPAAVTESVAAVSGVAVMAPKPLNYPATGADSVVLCTSWAPDNGTPLYRVNEFTWPYDMRTGYWTTDPASQCMETSSLESYDLELCRIWKAIDRRLGTNIAEIWQDCEPYDEFPSPI